LISYRHCLFYAYSTFIEFGTTPRSRRITYSEPEISPTIYAVECIVLITMLTPTLKAQDKNDLKPLTIGYPLPAIGKRAI
jgi:hypothetical protein